MITKETIGVGNRSDFNVLLHAISSAGIEHDSYYEDYDPTPWNAIVETDEEIIEGILRKLDERGIYYETTMRLPTTT